MITKINIPNGVKYLSDYIKELPVNCILDKGKVGSGGTTLAIKSLSNYVITVPFVSLIKNKVINNNEILGVYKETTASDIKTYLKNGGNKIMVTYDSLDRIMKYINPQDYNLLVDELHLLFLQYSFRRDAVQTVLTNYDKFRHYCFMTATPVENDFMLDELKQLPVIEYVWENVKEVKVNSIKCTSQIDGTVIQTINGFLSGSIEGNGYFFVNSLEFIEDMIKKCKLTEDNTRVIYSASNKKKLSIPRGETTDAPKKINFVTSTAFEGCDIMDYNGKIFIVSDKRKVHTLTDISTSFVQIAGRIRNTQYIDNIYHIYTETRYNNNLTYDEFKDTCQEQVNLVASDIVHLMNLPQHLRKKITIPLESYVAKSDDIFSFDANLVKIDLYNFKVTRLLYSLRVNVVEALKKEDYIVNESVSDLKVKDVVDMSKTEKVSFKSVVNYIKENPNDKDYYESACIKYDFLDKAIKILGYEKIDNLGYGITNIKKTLIACLDIQSETKVAKMLKMNREFSNGSFIASKRSKELISDIYKSLNITKTPNIKDYYEVKERVTKINGYSTKGYIIIMPKIVL